MGYEQYRIRRCIDDLRRDGSVIVQLPDAGKAQEWRAAIRRACRSAGMRVRTGLAGDGGRAWAYHVDHVLTEASSRAARRAIEAALAGDVTAPFHELVTQEQRKMLHPVPLPPRQP